MKNKFVHGLHGLTRIIFLLFVILFILPACSNKKDKKEIFDRAGRSVVINRQVERVISTAPSNTEIIHDLGLAHKLVAVDVHSANIKGLPDNIPLLDFFYPDAEVILNLNPDLIIASGHNATGAGEDPLALLREAGIPVTYISMSQSIEDIYKDIAFIAELLQEEEAGEELISEMRSYIDYVEQGINDLLTKYQSNKPAVYFEISAAPDMMTFGKESYINDMINIVGCINIFENDGWLTTPSAEAIIQRNPDIIFTTVNYIDDPIGEIKSRPGFNHINAVKNGRVFQIDNDSASRPSARIQNALWQMTSNLQFFLMTNESAEE